MRLLPAIVIAAAAALSLANCAKGPSSLNEAADAAVVNISSQSLFSHINSLQSKPALATVTAKLESTGILADYHRVLAQASNKPLKIDGVVFRNIKSRLAAQESYYADLDRRYGTIGNYLKSQQSAPGKLTANGFSKSLEGIKSAFTSGASLTDSLALDDQSACNAPKVWGCSNTGYALNAAGQVIPGQGGSLALVSTGAWNKNDDSTYTQTGTQTSAVTGQSFTTDLVTVPDLAAASYICDSVARSAAASTGGCDGAAKAAQAGESAAASVFNASPVSQVGTRYNCPGNQGTTCINGTDIAAVNTYNGNGSPVATNIH